MLVEIRKFGKEEKTAVTSLDVAETFGKPHDKVMRDIKELGCSPEFNIANFGDIFVSGLVDCGWDYERVKEFIQQTNSHKLLVA